MSRISGASSGWLNQLNRPQGPSSSGSLGDAAIRPVTGPYEVQQETAEQFSERMHQKAWDLLRNPAASLQSGEAHEVFSYFGSQTGQIHLQGMNYQGSDGGGIRWSIRSEDRVEYTFLSPIAKELMSVINECYPPLTGWRASIANAARALLSDQTALPKEKTAGTFDPKAYGPACDVNEPQFFAGAIIPAGIQAAIREAASKRAPTAAVFNDLLTSAPHSEPRDVPGVIRTWIPVSVALKLLGKRLRGHCAWFAMQNQQLR